ncbi:MAG: DUF6623 family protein [Candidatus Zixiibacteriota bacterium]
MADSKDIQIRVFGSRKAYADLDMQDEPRIADTIRNQILPHVEAEYYRIDVKVKRKTDRSPQYLIAYMLRKDIYLAETVKVDLEGDYNVVGTTWNYEESEEDSEAEEDEAEEFLDDDMSYAADFDIVVATPVPDIPTALQAINAIYDMVIAAGLRCKKLTGAEATVANYKTYLSSGLKGFVNVGHGNTTGIALHDGSLSYTWFNGVAGNAVNPAVVYFNSCQVHNDPLDPAVMKSGARTFIGGNVNLLIGPSEEVCKCFWNTVLTTQNPMGATLTQCERDHYPAEGSHGLSGDTGPFISVQMTLAHAMWIHGHSGHIENPERLSEEKRIGSCLAACGKAFNSTWFHFAIPTKAPANRKNLSAGSAMIRFRIGNGASIYAVDIYDAEKKIASHTGLNISGVSKFTVRKFSIPKHPTIKYGLGISVGVKFSGRPTIATVKPVTTKPGITPIIPPIKPFSTEVAFSSAGCEFVTIE